MYIRKGYRAAVERQGCCSEAFGIEILRRNRIKISQSTCKGTLTLSLKSKPETLEHAKRKKSNAKVEGNQKSVTPVIRLPGHTLT